MTSNRVWGILTASALVFASCGSDNRAATLGTGGHLVGAPGSGGTTSGGTVGVGGTTGPDASGGVPGSGGSADRGGTTGTGGSPTGTGGSATGGTAGRGTGGSSLGSGGVAGAAGGSGATRDAAAAEDAATDAPECPVCPPMRCAYGSPVDSKGCTVCTCNPAPDGAIDVSTDTACAVPEGCADTRVDTRPPADTGASRDSPADAIKCGAAICRAGEYCCNPLMDTCAPLGGGCGM